MLGVKGPMADCPAHEECLEWAHKYLKDCVCDFRDEISLTLGLISVLSWGVAEVPQILTNFREKSTEGVSLGFLMTWVVGDILNLTGCFLEPATLPTQFYMAVLYTITTIVLVGQTVYYDYVYDNLHPDIKPQQLPDDTAKKPSRVDVEYQRPQPIKVEESVSPDHAGTPQSSTINVPRSRRASRGAGDLFYTSARSLASSYTPTMGSYMVGSRESQTTTFLRPSQESSALLQDHSQHGPSSGPGSLASAAASILLVGSLGLTSNVLSGINLSGSARGGQGLAVFRAGRRLLQMTSSPQYGSFLAFRKHRNVGEAEVSGPWGEIFGWAMAAIYMGGRLPQILLNMKRGTVEGLSPFMFAFAVVGNSSYVGSILVRSLDWTTIKPNLPWLVDAAVCVGLDCFIICQFVYYTSKDRATRASAAEDEDRKGGYEAIR